MSDIVSKVHSIIVDKLNIEKSEILPTSSFTNDLGADSLDIVELIMEFEKEFDISIPDEKAEKITTIGEAIEAIESLLNEKGHSEKNI
ncbi:acyl carrier protein [Blattabacterium cuenoti]|nr:acyl carrier protein [Blattabacterium cuenoti]